MQSSLLLPLVISIVDEGASSFTNIKLGLPLDSFTLYLIFKLLGYLFRYFLDDVFYTRLVSYSVTKVTLVTQYTCFRGNQRNHGYHGYQRNNGYHGNHGYK